MTYVPAKGPAGSRPISRPPTVSAPLPRAATASASKASTSMDRPRWAAAAASAGVGSNRPWCIKYKYERRAKRSGSGGWLTRPSDHAASASGGTGLSSALVRNCWSTMCVSLWPKMTLPARAAASASRASSSGPKRLGSRNSTSKAMTLAPISARASTKSA